MDKVIWMATIKANDDVCGKNITIGIQKINNDEGTRYSVISSTNEDTSIAEQKTVREAAVAIACAWGECATYELLDTALEEIEKAETEEAERQTKVEEIVDALYEEMKSAYQVGNGLKSWHVEFWLNKETLESWTSEALSQNSWKEYSDLNAVRVCNIEIQDLRDMNTEYSVEEIEAMSEKEIDEIRDCLVTDFDAPQFIDAILEWAGARPQADDYDDNDEYREAKDRWAMEKPKMEEYWV